VPLTGASFTVVVATPCEFVTVRAWLILSEVDGAVTKDQTTESPDIGVPVASTIVAEIVKGAVHVMVPRAVTLTLPST